MLLNFAMLCLALNGKHGQMLYGEFVRTGHADQHHSTNQCYQKQRHCRKQQDGR
jgi:hypothetical protein